MFCITAIGSLAVAAADEMIMMMVTMMMTMMTLMMMLRAMRRMTIEQ